MMRNIYVVDEHISSKRNGIGTFLKEYIRSLKQLEVTVCLIVFNADCKEFSIEYKGGIRFLCFPKFQKGSFVNHPNLLDKFFRLYIDDSSDNVFCINHSPCGDLLKQIKLSHPLSKIVFTIHDLTWTQSLLGNESAFRRIVANRARTRIQKKHEQLLYAFDKELEMIEIVDKAICLSQSTHRLLLECYGVNEDKVHLIPNGLRDNGKGTNGEEKKRLRRESLIEENEKIVLFVGRINEAKGLYALLSAFDSVLKECPQTRLVIAGTSSYASLQPPSMNVASRTVYTGHLKPSDLKKWYQMADVGVIPSYTEQCSYVGIEMMMHGLPIVASDGFGVRDMFTNNVNAIIASIETYAAPTDYSRNLSDALIRLLSSDELSEELGRSARQVYQSCYGVSVMQKRYKEFFLYQPL